MSFVDKTESNSCSTQTPNAASTPPATSSSAKVPDPKSQVEQITIALIYKFMDDIDAQSEELGGQRTFFAGEFTRYGWARLMRPGLGGHEMLNLYAEAIGSNAREPRHSAALPRHLQQRLPPIPRPRNAPRLPQDHRRVHLRPPRSGSATPSSTCSPSSAHRATPGSSVLPDTSSTS